MRIILSPAKRMNEISDTLAYSALPEYIGQSEEILRWLQCKSYEELRKLWNCSDRIAQQNIRRFEHMNLRTGLTPAVLSYEGIAYQYMAPAVFEECQLSYIRKNLRILSAFYGVLRPMDGVAPYRLEMQAKAAIAGHKNLYELWGRRIYDAVRDEDGIIINLASKEYSKCVEKYLKPQDTYITCVFGEWVNGKVAQKGTYAKMARGEMVRFMAENGIEEPGEIKKFDRLNYAFREEMSSDREYVFIRQEKIE
ncbi:MAG: peroxide stress protein YaaA [Dorea sp.]|nr:peroxide stress protein YaaA [Dorea sp.]